MHQQENSQSDTLALIKSYGFREITGGGFQSWSSFTSHLFSGAGNRGEFDQANFLFDLDTTPTTGFTRSDAKDEESMESAYFGRPIDIATYHFPKTTLVEDQLKMINGVLGGLFSGKDTKSKPILVISDIKPESISAYYVWQFK